MWEYDYSTLCHGMKGHKYIRKERGNNGKWNYIYPDDLKRKENITKYRKTQSSVGRSIEEQKRSEEKQRKESTKLKDTENFFDTQKELYDILDDYKEKGTLYRVLQEKIKPYRDKLENIAKRYGYKSSGRYDNEIFQVNEVEEFLMNKLDIPKNMRNNYVEYYENAKKNNKYKKDKDAYKYE